MEISNKMSYIYEYKRVIGYLNTTLHKILTVDTVSLA